MPTFRSFRASVVVALFSASLPIAGCSCDEPRAVAPAPVACVAQGETLSAAAPMTNSTLMPGTMHASFSVDASGQPVVHMPIDVAAGRGAPALALRYDGTNVDGVLGAGFSLAGVEAVTLCPKSVAMDGEARAVRFDSEDALCAFGKRLVVTKNDGDVIHYVTWPDTQIRVVQTIKSPRDSSFEAFLPDGTKIRFGTSAATRPRGPNGSVRAWLPAERVNARGQVETSYGYCFANANDVTVEYALQEIQYSMASNDPSATRVVKLAYRTKEHAETTYVGGLPMQSSLELREIQSFGPDKQLALRYPLEMVESKTTGRRLLESVQECTGRSECTPPLRFLVAQPKTGFDDITTHIETPLSDKASFLLSDFDGDGLSDYLVGDSTTISTPAQPRTEWRWSKSTSTGFAPSQVALLQDWSLQQDSASSIDSTQM